MWSRSPLSPRVLEQWDENLRERTPNTVIVEAGCTPLRKGRKRPRRPEASSTGSTLRDEPWPGSTEFLPLLLLLLHR